MRALSEGPMAGDPQECHANALQCMGLAAEVKYPKLGATFLKLANMWTKASHGGGAAVPSIYGGFGLCTSRASRRAFAQITARLLWKRRRRSFKRKAWAKLEEAP